MEYKQFDFFSVIVEAFKSKRGTHLIVMKPYEDANDLCDVYSFESKEEFDKEFETKKHPYYPGNFYWPRIVEKRYGDYTVDCILNGERTYVCLNHVHLIIDGELVKS